MRAQASKSTRQMGRVSQPAVALCKPWKGCAMRSFQALAGHLHGDDELAGALHVAVVVRVLPGGALQQVRVVAQLAEDVDAGQRVLPVLHPHQPQNVSCMNFLQQCA